MLRTLLIYLSQANWARSFVMNFALARRVALRFVAGETLAEAVQVVQTINNAGMLASLDLLGEHSDTPKAAQHAASKIIESLDAIAENNLRATLSIKLTQIGLKLDQEVCFENLLRICRSAHEHQIFVRIDMEEAEVLEATLGLIEAVQNRGFNNIGAVIQSYLFRSTSDVNSLLNKKTTIRLVKGAYKELPKIAYPKKKDVDQSFDRLTSVLLDASLDSILQLEQIPANWPPIAAIASHDEMRVRYAENYGNQIKLDRKWLEFQMLYGIRRDLQADLNLKGYPVRVYVPFGIDWYPYFMRRLAERPANLWFFLSNLIRN